MAYNDNQNESPLPTPGNTKRSAVDLIPKFFRTEANRKFLQGTIDQLIQPGVAEKLNGFVGRSTAKAFAPSDNYVEDVSSNRKNYQLEPAAVVSDELGNVSLYKDYNDYVGSLDFFGASVKNHDRLNSQDSYAWTPHVDWDKFVNFREYYWLPNGPDAITVKGNQREVISTYTVTAVTADDNTSYVFNSGFTRNPTLTLYKGQTYRFEIDAVGHPIAFSLSRSFTPGLAILTAGTSGLRADGLYDSALYGNSYDQGNFIILPDSGSVSFADDDNVSTLYPDGIRKLGSSGEEVATVYVERGTIEFTVPHNAPANLFYISKNSIDTSGLCRIADIEENTSLNVATDMLGKKTYLTADGLQLSNGMKLTFAGNITPKKYSQNQWFVEGVGSNIQLIKDTDLVIPAAYSTNRLVPFDSDQFDSLPYGNASAYAAEKDYIVINKASKDRNAWSRYNCWYHKSVVEASYTYNNLPVAVDESTRAKRPIIEFEAGLKLYNSGTASKLDVSLVDTFTADVFSTIEGQLGYSVDGVDLTDGQRILFTADTDILVSGKIYEVKFVNINNTRQISLVESADSNPYERESVFVTNGTKYAGKTFYFTGTAWKQSQEKLTRNQAPLFDLYCSEGNAYADTSLFNSSSFTGTKLFSYRESSGTPDAELGFPITYRNIENSGDILFDFNLLSDTFSYQLDDELITVNTNTSNLQKFTSKNAFTWVNGWSSNPVKSVQYVVRQYTVDEFQLNNFAIDVYDNSGNLSDLKTIAYVNNKLQVKFQDYETDNINNVAYVRFYNDLSASDNIILKTQSATTKNANGYYEFPHNLERNPNNEDVTEFTLGEVIDHVDSMVAELVTFTGAFPGNGNLRDISNAADFGKKFVKHSGPINLPLYHLTSKTYNIVNALRYSKDEYSKFKRMFLETASTLGFDSIPRIHVDKILQTMNKDKINSQPFYFSDMLGHGPSTTLEYEVLDARSQYYALSSAFDLDKLSNTSVNVYLNSEQLTTQVDYTFDGTGFVIIDAGQTEGDLIEIVEYSTTDGTFIPPTPTKLGLYPKYAPELTIDDTYQNSTMLTTGPYKVYGEVIDGHADAGVRGWVYPLYTSISAAKAADVAAGGSGEYKSYQFRGLSEFLYIAVSDSNTIGGQDNIELDIYPVGVPMIRGHDGSYVTAYLDFRDNLILEVEKRIFNNIKVTWSSDTIDVAGYVGGAFRPSEYTSDEINASLLTDFTQWLKLVDNDYTSNSFYERTNDFTFNYSNANGPSLGLSPSDTARPLLPGFWRGVYRNAFDTDRPHTHPWEMLGFSIKPAWWNISYGPAPYTSNNLVMWRDLADGIVRVPNKEIELKSGYARPGLLSFIPVNAQGKLTSPLASSYVQNFVLRLSTQTFKFGDEAPVETAWRRSSQYPFSILTSMLLNKPAAVMGAGFDVSRMQTNLANQRVYTPTLNHIDTSNIVFPNTVPDRDRISTSGFVNYIYNLIASDAGNAYESYQTELSSLTTRLGFRLGGFTDKKRLNIILESRTPSAENQGSIFVPAENYQVVFNTSSPIDYAVYSGIAIEKVPSGYVIRGYNTNSPVFNYYPAIVGSDSVYITVGGISETSSIWEADRVYNAGIVLTYNSLYYRVLTTFTSGAEFSATNLSKLPSLPITGGRRAQFNRDYDNTTVLSLQYGSKLDSFQEVVNFILGYSARLKDQGFEFDFVEADASINNWEAAAKEFLFWTTQGWAAGTVITVSPAANRFTFKRDYTVVDNIYDSFYNYSMLQADGQSLQREFSSLVRDVNSFGIETVNTDQGLYAIELPLVQKEHVVIIDNTTIFNDIIYQPATGYRRDRVKISGYRSADWNGGLNIPGFVFDNAEITIWTSWKDYKIGSLIKHKQYYYVATTNVSGSNEFDPSPWHRLSEKPEAELLTNFDYKINQFSDFYDLDTDGFDPELQRMAQHLTGYQKRQYLANIITDDISQYKFYQGMLQDKGTSNALSKMFAKLGAAGNESLEFYEEWALQVGKFGAVDNIAQIEVKIDMAKMQESPQAIEFTDSIPTTNYDKIYRILPREMHDTPTEYTHAPFPTAPLSSEYVRTSGYVTDSDITYIASSVTELQLGDANLLGLGEYVWVTELTSNPWDVFQHIETLIYATDVIDRSVISSNGVALIEITTDKWAVNHVAPGDIIGIRSAQEYGINGLYIIDSINLNTISIQVPVDNEIKAFSTEKFLITKLRSVRVKDLGALSELAHDTIYNDQRVWVDNIDNSWEVLQNDPVYSNKQTLPNPEVFDGTIQGYGTSIAGTADNNNIFVSAADSEKLYYYRRTNESFNLVLDQEINLAASEYSALWTPSTVYVQGATLSRLVGGVIRYYIANVSHTSALTFSNVNWTEVSNPNTLLTAINSGFAKSFDVSPDGEYLVVGMPQASNVKTKFTGEFIPTIPYTKGDVVKYQESLWKSNRDIAAEVTFYAFDTFNTYTNLASISGITSLNLLVTGDPGLFNTAVDHILVRAPNDMYLGTSAGDTVSLYWNRVSYAYPTLDAYLPFGGNIPEITPESLSQDHVIVEKIDHVFYIESYIALPIVGDIVTTNTASAEVFYTSTGNGSAVVYVKGTNGVFGITGELAINDEDIVGSYTDVDTRSATNAVAGFWYINTDTTYANIEQYRDIGQGLTYADVRIATTDYDLNTPGVQLRSANRYYNIQDAVSAIGNYVGVRNQVSFMTQLSFTGDLAVSDAASGINASVTDNRWVVRVSKTFSDTLSIADSLNFRVYDLANRIVDLPATGLDYSITNATQVITDVWDGYIDFALTRFDFSGFPYQPQIGDTIADVQTMSNSTGGLSQTNSTTSTAEIVWIQRNFNNVRVYVNNITGTWAELTNIGRYEIRRLANPALRGINDVDRIVGTIANPDASIAVGTAQVGKLLVFANSSPFADIRTWDTIPAVVDEEYYVFSESTEQGVGSDANYPYSQNKDYTQIYHISADAYGEAGPVAEGAIALYRRQNTGKYRLQDVITSEYTAANRNFGNSVKIKQVDNYYTLLVSSVGNATRDDPGSIEIFRHGVKPTDNFKGDYQVTTYNKGDIVLYNDSYYVAKKEVTPDTLETAVTTIENPTTWDNISWKRGKDDNYRGQWASTYTYSEDDIVLYNNSIYKSLTNIAAGELFNLSAWTADSTYIDYVGLLPNMTGFSAYNELTFNPELGAAIKFSSVYDVSADANVIVTTAIITEVGNSPITQLVIYRATGDKFILSQIIDSPELYNLDNWASNISINPAGTSFVISAQLDDTTKYDQGVVYVYKQVNGQFELSQTLTPPNNEESEQFGYSVSYGENNLVVSSLNGDQTIPTTFDDTTTFDNNFTNFRNVKLDTGVVYIFEDIGARLTYSEQFRYDAAQNQFGEHITSINNHVYVGIPSHAAPNSKGIVVDYRKLKGATSWNTLRSGETPVDISRIEGAFLYNTRSNQIVSYIDYIDPVQGKIAGNAEQEITFKIGIDPATYNVGNLTDVSVVPATHWGAEHVGQVWWNISTARFAFAYQGSTTFQKNQWNKLMPGASIDVYEWVESAYLPTEWDQLADTDEGTLLGISGIALYGDTKYSAKIAYDDISQTFSTTYYYWVQNKKTIPESRVLSISNIAALIATPREQGYRYISFLSDSKIVLNNIDNLITSNDIVLNIRYSTGIKTSQNRHLQYMLMSDGLDTSKPTADVERKWFDSLIGVDTNNRVVPDTAIPLAKRYGIQNRPRQGMFVNRLEALKQYVDRVNVVLLENLIVDQRDISRLSEASLAPAAALGQYDVSIDNFIDISNVSTNKVTPAVITPVITDGSIESVSITTAGRGYKIAPRVLINGTGVGAEIELEINNLGQVVNATIINNGSGYNTATSVTVRNFAVLVANDESLNGKWAVYSWNSVTADWVRTSLQEFDVNAYWKYVDWYAAGYNQFTPVNFATSATYLLPTLGDSINDIVKVTNVGTGGWVMLRKVANEITEDYIVNYETIGRQHGTIQLLDTLYDYNKNTVGYDNRSYDSFFYDNTPSIELRIIFETIRDSILITDLATQYNQLFFASLRYIFSEQPRVDWMFKSSFINIKHNLGNLTQAVNFENNKLPSYEAYVNEVKPYSTKIREFVSSFTNTDNTSSSISDFDNAPLYDALTGTIVTSDATIINSVLTGTSSSSNVYPRKHWNDNVGYAVTKIAVSNPGAGYTSPPDIELVSSSGTGATAIAYIGSGKITAIKITNPGRNYITVPSVIIKGSRLTSGTTAIAAAVLGDGLVRTPSITIKFDRLAGVHTIENLSQTETFTGSNVNVTYSLVWPMDLDTRRVSVFVNGVEQLRSKYTYANVTSYPATAVLLPEFNYGTDDVAAGPGTQTATNGITTLTGQLTFTTPPANNAVITINYYKPISMLSAEDRIKFAYTPIAGMFGNNLAQLMTGVDYGGVEVKGFDFDGARGWDAQGWYTDTWDTYDNAYEDDIFFADGSTIAVELSKPLELGIIYNLYRNGIRLDDEHYNTNLQSDPSAITNSITGDGVTVTVDLLGLGVEILDGDTLIIRKNTSDGSIIPDNNSYDIALTGGDLSYTTATGIAPEEIIVDGDGFVTPTTSSGPEELVPGHLFDTLDISVYSKDVAGQILSQTHIATSEKTVYNLGIVPTTRATAIVKTNGTTLLNTAYTINMVTNTITVPDIEEGTALSIILQPADMRNVTDYATIVAVGAQVEYVTEASWSNTALAFVFATVNGVAVDVETYKHSSNPVNVVAFRFTTAPVASDVIQYTVFKNNETSNYSQVSNNTFISDGVETSFALSTAPLYSLATSDNIVVTASNRILAASEYTITDNVVVLNTAVSISDVIEICQFSNHDILDIVRAVPAVISSVAVLFEDIAAGEIELQTPAIDAEYVWVTLNDVILSHGVDYNVTADKMKVQLVNTTAESDIINITYVAGQTTYPKFAYRQFKDMLNRTHFKRLPTEPTTVLAVPVNSFDLRIEVVDGSLLAEPNKGRNMPGIVWINSERIEYFVKDGNLLRQLRRGTLGTGTKAVHDAGSDVIDQNSSNTMPYTDRTIVQLFKGDDIVDGITNTFAVEFAVNNVHEVEVFVAGTRMRKSAIPMFNPNIALNSPAGDIEQVADFSIEAGAIVLNTIPAVGTVVTVIKKVGQAWTHPGISLANTDTYIARFVRD